MYDLVRREIGLQLRGVHEEFEEHYTKLRGAWQNARSWAKTGKRPLKSDLILIPYVGSGLNRLAEGGLGSWGDLVRVVSKHTQSLGSPHQIKRSELSMPQQLEMHLRKAALHQASRNSVRRAFDAAFSAQTVPSSFHKRLATMFPVLLTTNYNDLLALSDSSKSKTVLDLTDPDFDPNCIKDAQPSIYHLHGRWASPNRKAREEKIFAGVGIHGGSDRPRLVLTENQYHRLYSDDRFSRALETLLGPPTVLLFLGASLSRDEAGIHGLLTDRRLAGGQFAGLYVGLDLDPLKEELLELRGIRCINLRRAFGFSRGATEALFHALFDELEKDFHGDAASLATPPPTLGAPDILCAGLASWNRVFSLGSRETIGTETSHVLGKQDVVEEPGGQHLAPALYLATCGHRVAIATTMGDDDLGDQIKKWLTERIDRLANTRGAGDLIVYFRETSPSTRLTTAVTYGGTRVTFDYDNHGLGALKLEQVELDEWSSIKALYLGSYYLDAQERLLDDLSHVKWKFFETGTQGPSDVRAFERVVKAARRCTHVLSSSEFALRLAKPGADLARRNCQHTVYKDAISKGEVTRKAFENLWPSAGSHGYLIIVMGNYGSLVVSRNHSGTTSINHVRAAKVPTRKGRNWLGCGDMYRAEFIHQIVSKGARGASPVHAAKAASRVVAQKIQRMTFLP